MKTTKRTFNVNEIKNALEEKFRVEIVIIQEAFTASAENQRNPISREIGWGGVLNIICEIEKKKR